MYLKNIQIKYIENIFFVIYVYKYINILYLFLFYFDILNILHI